jgi:LysR family transcriptional activator of nhaA
MPKLIVRELLAPALHLPEPVRLICREDRPERLISALGLHELDVVLCDAPAPAGSHAYSQLLGECPVALYATPRLARSLTSPFPACLQGAPLLLPGEGSSLRRTLDHWLRSRRLEPRVVAELEDSALMTVLGADGLGVFPSPAVLAEALRTEHGVVELGRAGPVRERFYALTVQRRVSHPGVVALTDGARAQLFAGG